MHAISRTCIAMEGLVTQIIHSFMTGNEHARIIQTSLNQQQQKIEYSIVLFQKQPVDYVYERKHFVL